MTTNSPETPVNGKYGAPMGRPNEGHGFEALPRDPPFNLRRVRLNSGGYDAGGAYWGIGQALWWYASNADCGIGEGISGYLRASSRGAAKDKVCAAHGVAVRFYR